MKWIKRTLPLMMAAFVLAACAVPTNAETAVDASGSAEIPADIIADLDEETIEQLTEKPKYVALTFDDGPRADTTSVLLDGLLERGVPATFFVVGEQIEGNEELIERMKAEGHQIGNHTYSHVRLLNTELDQVIEEIHKTEVLLEEIVGEGDFWLRPPYGFIDSQRAALVETPMIYWSLDPQDWKLRDAGKVTDYVVENVKAGDIILLHDFYASSVEAALNIIDKLQEQGYTFVTVEELFRIQGVTPEAGQLYASPEKTRPLS